MPSLNTIGIPFIKLPVIDSTNNYAMGLVREGMAQHGTAVFAHEQTRGKGQRNKEWSSAKGLNIATSIVIEPQGLNHTNLFLLSMASALSVFHLFNRYIPEDLTIKWPNDIYWRDRKAAGILIENLWQQQHWKFAVVGIGINVNQADFGKLAQKAVSMKQITGREFDPVELAKELCEIFEIQYRQLLTDAAQVAGQYRQQLYRLNETARLKKGNRIFDAVIKDVSLDGRLVVQHAIEESFEVGEVEWVI